jgi:RNA polymerase sigma factor (sigma-70 family)
MATAKFGVVLRHIRGLAADATISERTDGTLLRTFLCDNDPAAFEALLRRHGPMVLRVCRRALGNAHDAEDALQATFLVLAQRAASIRKRESLASWLYGVAYRMATDARRAAARRHKHESRANPTPPRDPALSAAWQELQTLLDEEIAALPETLREAFVLCCLENKSSAEVAQQLGLEQGAVWKRLSRARKRLQERLTRRGVSLTAVLAAVAVGVNGASAAIPVFLVRSTARAATALAAGQGAAAGLVPTKVAALTEGVLKAMFKTNLKTAGLVVLAVVLVGTGTGVLTYRALAAGQPGPAPAVGARQAPAADQPKGTPPGPKDPAAPADEKKDMAFAGRVVDADGKPVAADVALLGDPKSNPPHYAWLGSKVLAHGRADAVGKFRLGVARAALADSRAVYAIAGKAGHGPALARADLKRPAHETVVRLAPEKVVRGRLRDLQGQPASGVRVSLTRLFFSDKSARKDSGLSVYVNPPEGFPSWPGPVTTGKDGKFVIAGLNPDLGGLLEIDGEEFTIASAGIGAGKENGNQEVNLTLAPARVLEGVVTAADTGKPVPRARVMCVAAGRFVSCQADEKGHYRLRAPGGPGGEGLPGAPSTVSAVPPEGQPYLLREAPLDWPQGAVKHRINLALERGVHVRGIVTDAATGKPIAGAKARAVAPEGPQSRGSSHPDTSPATTGDDGAFAVVVPPGRRSHVLVKGPNNDYVAVEITEGELQGGKRFGYRVYPHAVVPIEAKAGTEALEVTAKLRRGVTLRGKLLGPGDKPAADALLVCWNQLEGGRVLSFAGVPVRDGTFELRGCDPEVTYPVYFLDAQNKLGATAHLSAKEAAGQEVTVRLEPCGSAVVRFLDKEGKPRKGYRPDEYKGRLVLRPGNNRPGDKGVNADSASLGNVDTVNYSWGLNRTADAEGRLTYPVLIPGATYRFDIPEFKTIKELTVKPGETLKTDIVIDRP